MSDHSTIQHPRWCDPAQCSQDRSPVCILHCSTPSVVRAKDATFNVTLLRSDEAWFDHKAGGTEMWLEVEHNVMDGLDSQIGLDAHECRNLILALISQYRRTWSGDLLVLGK